MPPDSMPTPRLDARSAHQLRPLTLAAHIAPYAGGSVLIGFGQTRVICAATIEPKVPSWMRQQGVSGGWVTAEYSMLPYSTLERKARDMSKGKIDGRTIEIQRLIGRSIRAVLDLKKFGEHTLWLDCDVLQAAPPPSPAPTSPLASRCRNSCMPKKLPRTPSPTRSPRSASASLGARPYSILITSKIKMPKWMPIL